MFRHASIYDARSVPRDEGDLRVLVMRHWPRGVRRETVDLWLKDAAPSRDLLHAYNHAGLGWDAFERRYLVEMAERPDVLERLRTLEREHASLTLLCHERMPPGAHCHRTVLLELLTKELARS